MSWRFFAQRDSGVPAHEAGSFEGAIRGLSSIAFKGMVAGMP
jgi:hypothetical protein